jgi:hypothetical protein
MQLPPRNGRQLVAALCAAQMRMELAEKELALLEKEKALLTKEQTVTVLTEEVGEPVGRMGGLEAADACMPRSGKGKPQRAQLCPRLAPCPRA